MNTLFDLEPITIAQTKVVVNLDVVAPKTEMDVDYGQIGGIYIHKSFTVEDPDTEWNVSFGKGLHLLYDGIDHIDSDVEIGGFHNYTRVQNYALSVNKLKMVWRIKDTGFKCAKHILAEGACTESFIKSLSKYMKCFMK